MLAAFGQKKNPTLDVEAVKEGAHTFMEKCQGDAYKHDEALQNDVDALAEYLWTSANKHPISNRMELCSVIDAVIRDDMTDEIAAAVIYIMTVIYIK